MTDAKVRRCHQQQISALAWRRAQPALQAEFERLKEALTASLIEHIEAGRDADDFFHEQHHTGG